MLNTHRLQYRTPRASRGGFTLVELLVVIGIIAILAGVALGPITRGIKQAQESTSVQVAHQLGALCFAYSNDNIQLYPYGATSEAIANSLLNGGYANNPSIFYVAGTKSATKYTGATTPYNLGVNDCNWDFMVNGTTGLDSSANDGTPLCQLTGSTAVTGLPTTSGTGLTLTINPSTAAFGADGIAVYYKGNNSVFVKTQSASATTATNVPTASVAWIPVSYADPKGGGYKLVQP